MSRDYDKYGWKCNEDNLSTLPSSAPSAAHDLARWLTLEGRRSSVTEWINNVNPTDDRIHGKFWHIGAWTHRMSHSKPNQANIMSCWPKDKEGKPVTPTTAVEEVKYKYDDALRRCWTVPSGFFLVGADAESIQLRILAHYMESKVYIDAICSGDKDKETDIHNVNRRALGTDICKSRDAAKTWIYAWLLGAANAKQASILGCTSAQAKKAEANFLEAMPELRTLRSVQIKRDARRGFFYGLDGRKVKCNSEHLMLSGYLQNGESIVVKNWVLATMKQAKMEGLPSRLVDVVHDETQIETSTEGVANRLLEIQKETIVQVGKDLGVKCPLAADGRIGRSWYDTH